MKELDNQEIEETHNKLKEILEKYGNEEFGDCITDEICFCLGILQQRILKKKTEREVRKLNL